MGAYDSFKTQYAWKKWQRWIHGKAENIYAIGLGVNGLSTTDIGYAEKCEIANIEKTTTFDTTNHTFKITVNNPTDEAITFTTIKTTISNIQEITELILQLRQVRI